MCRPRAFVFLLMKSAWFRSLDPGLQFSNVVLTSVNQPTNSIFRTHCGKTTRVVCLCCFLLHHNTTFRYPNVLWCTNKQHRQTTQVVFPPCIRKIFVGWFLEVRTTLENCKPGSRLRNQADFNNSVSGVAKRCVVL